MTLADRIRATLGFVGGRKRDYQQAFGSPAGQRVLTDLAVFCRADETCVVALRGHPVDRDRTLILEGRRETWLRIQEHINLTPEQLFALYGGQAIPTGEDE